MYYNENMNQIIYCPDVVQSPANQQSYYSNGIQKQISEIEYSHKLLNDRFEISYNTLNKKTKDLYTSFRNLVDLQKQTTGELSQHKNRLENLKKRLINRLHQLENITSKELQSYITSQESMKNTVFEKLDQQEKIIDGKIQPVIGKYVTLKKQLLEHLEQNRLIVFNELQLVINQQENINRQMVEQLDTHELTIHKEFQPFINQQEKVNRQVVDQLGQQENANKRALDQLQEHEIVILKELQPFIKSIQDNLANPIASLLKNLSPGTLIKQITVQGTKIEVKCFLDYNLHTNISTFILESNKVMSINTSGIDSLTYG